VRVLIADDDDVCRLELASVLTGAGYEVAAVTDGREAWEALQGPDPPRLAVLDWFMPEMDGVDVCRRVRQNPALADVYVIVLTSRADQEHVVAGLQAGANDYVTKPFNRHELLARLRVGERMVGLHAELAARARELAALATTDELTGVGNRRALETRLEAECLNASNTGSPVALLLLDIDRFKSMNDRHGHPAGDEALKTMGLLLSSVSRKTDFVGRYGGEEFAVILVNADMASAREIAERLRSRIEAEPWPYLPVTASFGIASGGGGPVVAAELIRQADGALYFSKQHGRNQVTHWNDIDFTNGPLAAGGGTYQAR
jgi:diguanylate cyclase (GGDEF)-like protein